MDREGEGADVVFGSAVNVEEVLVEEKFDVVGVPEVECGVCVEDWGEFGEEGFGEQDWGSGTRGGGH